MAANGNGHTDLTANQELMSNGSVMTYYYGPVGEPSKKSVFVWWEEGPAGKLGTIYFNEEFANRLKTKIDGQSLPLSKITDVFSGKQQPIFKAASFAEIPSDQCFSLGSKVLPLNLQAESAPVRQAWITGIKEVFSKSQATKKGTVVASAPAPPVASSASGSTTAAAPGPTVAAASSTNSQAAADPIAAMVEGQRFTAVTGLNPSTKQEVFVFYEREISKFGVLYQAPASDDQQRTKDETTAIAMHRVSDVYLGKRAPELAGEATTGVPSNQCFSIVSKERSLHLIAPNEGVRKTYIDGIKAVFDLMKQAKQSKNKNEPAPAAATTAAATTTPVSPKAAEAEKPAPGPASAPTASTTGPPNVLADGRVYRSLSTDSNGVVSSKQIFMWHNPNEGKLGTLYYSDYTPGQAPIDTSKPGQYSMPVSKIKDVFLGRQTAEFKSDFAKDISSKECFSLMLNKDKGEGLHLVAQDESTRNATLSTIKDFWAQPKKKSAAATAATEKSSAPAPPVAQASSTVPAGPPPAEDQAEKERAKEQEKKRAAEAEAAAQKEKSEAAAAATTTAAAAATPKKPLSVDSNAQTLNTEGPTSPVSPSKKSEQLALANEVNADPIGNVNAMREGAVFKSWTIVPVNAQGEQQRQPEPEDVFVFLSDSDPKVDGPIGTIYWNEGAHEQRTKHSDRALPLSQTKDVFVGIHAWKKAGVKPLPSFPTTQALSLVSNHNALHLQAKDDRTRAVWATGVRNVFEAAHKKADENRKTNTVAAAPAPAVVVVNAAASSNNGSASPKAAGAPPASGASALQQGSVFTSHRAGGAGNGELISKPVFVFLDKSVEKLGTIYWCEPGKREIVPGQSIPLHKVSDVHLGKHKEYKDLPGSQNIRTANCFTLQSKAVTIHLEATSAEHRSKTIEEIKSVFTESGKKVDENATPVKKPAPSIATGSETASASDVHVLVLPEVPMSPRNAGADGSSGAVSPSTLSAAQKQPLPVVATPIGEGQDFEQWSFDDSGKNVIQTNPVHVWFEKQSGSLGALFWAPGHGNRTKVADQILPLQEVTDVFVGKHVEEFQTEKAKDLAQDRCISLRSQTHPNHNLNLVAATAQIQRRWIRGLRAAFKENPETVIETRPVKSGQIPPEAIASPKSARAIKTKLVALQEGHSITSVRETGESSKVQLWFEPSEGRAGTLYWSEAKDVKKQEQSIAVHTIANVYVGKKTPVWKHEAFKNVSSHTAFSVASKTKQLDAYVSQEDERKKILEGLQAAITAAGTPMREYVHTGASPSPPATTATQASQTSPSSANGPAVAINAITSDSALRQQLSFIEQGQVVLLHHTAGAEPRPIFLWYEPGYGKQGALFWSDVKPQQQPTKTKQPKQTILLQHLSDVLVAKQTDILKASPSPSLRGENSFSLLTSNNGPRLDIQVASKRERDEWLGSLRTIFTATSKRIVEGSGVPHSRKLQPGTIVDTWYGRGVVVSPTRKDGLTKIDVGGTTCFFNGESIKPTPLLYTPYGQGVSPVQGGEKRADGIRKVELAWATAYLNDEAISTKPPQPRAQGASESAGAQSREQSVAFLVQGQAFTHIGPQKHTPVFLYLNPQATASSSAAVSSSANLGSIEYNMGSVKSGPPLGSIPLRTLSDLLLGKQTPMLRALGSQVPDARAFSIVTKDGQALDLVSSTEMVRTDFIYALFNLLSGTGRKITQSRGGAIGPVGAATAATNGSSTGEPSRRTSALPSHEQAIKDLSTGASFKITILTPDGRRTSDDAFVFFQPSENRLIWSSTYWTSSAPSPKDPIRILNLKSVRDVWFAKKTPFFLEESQSSVASERCFSLGTKEKLQWNLIAPTKQVRDKFFFSLQALLTKPSASGSTSAAGQSSVHVSPSPVAAGGPSSSVSPGPRASASPPAVDPNNAVAVGAVFTKWSGEGADVKGEKVFLFHAHDGTKYGSLYWNSTEGDRTLSLARSMSLAAVRDVYMGKNTRTTRSPKLEQVPKDVLFSLVAQSKDPNVPPSTLNLEASSAAARTEFVNALKGYWKNTTVSSIKPSPLTPAQGQSAASSSSSASAGPAGGFGQPAQQLVVKVTGPELSQEFLAALNASSQRSIQIAPLPAVQFLQTGSKFSVGSREQDVFYVAASGFDVPFGSIYHSAVGSRELNDDNQIAIHRLEKVVVTENSIALHTSTQGLALSGADSNTLSAWLSGLSYLLAAAGFRVTSDAEGKVFSINDASATESAPATLALPAAVTTAPFKGEGVVVNGLFASFSGTSKTTSRVPIRLWLADDSIVWSSAAAPKVVPSDAEHVFPLGELTRITVGKNGASSAQLQTKDNSLEFEASSQEQLSFILAGLSAVLQEQRFSVKNDRSSDSLTKRAYTLARIVTIRLGPTSAADFSPKAAAIPSSPGSDEKALAAFLAEGALVTAYTRKKGQLLHKDLILWLGTDATGASYLYWGSASDAHARARQPDEQGDNELEVDEILTAQVGKFTPVLQAVSEADGKTSHCVSITSSSSNLDLVAESTQQAKAIVQAIRNLKPKALVV